MRRLPLAVITAPVCAVLLAVATACTGSTPTGQPTATVPATVVGPAATPTAPTTTGPSAPVDPGSGQPSLPPPVTPSTPSTPSTPAAPDPGPGAIVRYGTVPDAAPQGLAQARARIAQAPGGVRGMADFVSPSGNVYCLLAGSAGGPTGCEIEQGRVFDTRCASAGGGGGARDVGRWSFDGRHVLSVECNSDTIRTDWTTATLPYGTAARAPGGTLVCLAEQIGVTCVEEAGDIGVFIARGGYAVLS